MDQIPADEAHRRGQISALTSALVELNEMKESALHIARLSGEASSGVAFGIGLAAALVERKIDEARNG